MNYWHRWRGLLVVATVVALLGFLSSGCATRPSMTPQERAEAYRADVEAIYNKYSGPCESIGFPIGSQENLNCIVGLYQQEQAEIADAQRRSSIAAAIMGQGLSNFGQSFQNAAPPRFNTTCRTIGGTLFCN